MNSSKAFYRGNKLLKPNIILPKEGLVYPITGRTWLCRMGRHKEIHLACQPPGLCAVICERCGTILYQHELERLPNNVHSSL